MRRLPTFNADRDFPKRNADRDFPVPAIFNFILIPGYSKRLLLGQRGHPFGDAYIDSLSLISTIEWKKEGGSFNTLTVNEVAAQFTSANSEFLSIADNTNLSISDADFTFTAWVYMDTKPTEAAIVSKFGAASAGEYIIRYRSSTDRFEFVIADGSTTVVEAADNFGSPSTATWYFIVAWWDSSAGSLNIQVNNGTTDTGTTAVNPTDTTKDFNLGSYNASNFWNGRISKVGFWKRELTTLEKSWLYNNGKGRYHGAVGALGDGSALATSIKGYWNLSEPDTTRLDSASTNDLADNSTVTSTGGINSNIYPDVLTAAKFLPFKAVQFDSDLLFSLKVTDTASNIIEHDVSVRTTVEVNQNKIAEANQTIKLFADATFAIDKTFVSAIKYEVTGATTVSKVAIARFQLESGTHNGAGNSASLIDTTKDFLALGVRINDIVKNTTDSSEALVTGFATTTNSNDTLTLATLTGGTDNDFDASDNYTIEEGDDLVLIAQKFERSFSNTGLHTVTLYITDTSSNEFSDVFILEVG